MKKKWLGLSEQLFPKDKCIRGWTNRKYKSKLKKNWGKLGGLNVGMQVTA
jgi:hypothetical protein